MWLLKALVVFIASPIIIMAGYYGILFLLHIWAELIGE